MKMKFTKLWTILTFIFILISLSSFLQVKAEEEQENIVSAPFNIALESATDLKITVEASVTKITLSASGRAYTAQEIKGISSTETMGAVKYALKTMISDQLIDSFKNAKITAPNELLTYENEKFYDEYLVNLTSNFFNLNETSNPYELINGLLDVGAYIRYDLNLKADAGWDIIYSFDLGEKLEYKETNGKTDLTNNIIEWTVENRDGALPLKSAYFIIYSKNPTTAEETEDISIDFILNSKKEIVSFESKIAVKNMNLNDYDFLPDCITFKDDISFVPSDAIRLFVKNDLLTWDEIYQKTIKNIQDKIKNTVETSVFNQTLTLAFSWDNTTTDGCLNPFDIEKMDKNPPVTALLKDDKITILLNGISSRASFGLINTGAKANITPNSINFGKNLDNLGYPYNITLQMPTDITLNNENSYTWDNKLKNFSGLMLSEKSPDYEKPVINTIIEIKAETTDLNLLSFFTGETELSFGLKIEKEKNYKVTEIPEPFSITNDIDITYLNSDAVRLCIEENVFKDEEVDTFLTNEKTFFEQTINNIIKGLDAKGNINNDVFQNSLQWDGNITKMDGETPVKTQIYSYTSHPVKFKMSILPPSLKINNQAYSFTGLENQHVTYKIIFPKGIRIYFSNEYTQISINETSDGEQYIEVTFSPEESQNALDFTLTLEPSLLFIISIFIPCIVSFVILLILIITLILFRRKRKKRKISTYSPPEPMDEQAGYEDEDYYIPPPPGSK
jgi:hypothetical protein